MLVLLFAYSINFVQRYIFISNYYFKMQVFLYICNVFYYLRCCLRIQFANRLHFDTEHTLIIILT